MERGIGYGIGCQHDHSSRGRGKVSGHGGRKGMWDNCETR